MKLMNDDMRISVLAQLHVGLVSQFWGHCGCILR